VERWLPLIALRQIIFQTFGLGFFKNVHQLAEDIGGGAHPF
jgi:hypothetical protein